MISKIWPVLGNYNSNNYDLLGNRLMNVSKFNLFIGCNNSGKSRFLRSLFSLVVDLHIDDDEFRLELNKIYDLFKMSYNMEFDDLLLGVKFSNFRDYYGGSLISFINQLTILEEWNKIKNAKPYNTVKIDNTKFRKSINKRYYIPVIRGMRPYLKKDYDVYKERTIKDYFSKDNASILNTDQIIITGIHLHSLLTEKLLGKPDGRKEVYEFEKLLSKIFFNEQEVTLIPEHDTDTVAVKLGEDDQFPIYDLGDGIQQAIIITSAVFFAPVKSFFFIEEPENNMHPGLLRKLADFFLNLDHQFFITTHSNHLLDLAEVREDVFIHSFSKQNGSFQIKEHNKTKEILTDLGVKASSVYLTNCTIWVEGITDRLYLRCFMKKYIESQKYEIKERLEKYIENSHYAFIEYQGANLVHWNFSDHNVDGGKDKGLSALKTASNIFLIADGDIAGPNKRDRKIKLEEELGDKNLHAFDGKEIENLLPEFVLKRTIRKYPKKSESLDTELIKEEKYKNSEKGIGTYLDEIFDTEIWSAKSGTIKGKVDFCKKAVEVMNKEKWKLTNELEVLCKRIFDHIEKYNK